MMKKVFLNLSVIFLLGNLQNLHADKIPIPEFYGIYVVADGKLIELKPSEVRFGDGQVGLKKFLKVEVMDNKAYIIVYQKNVEPTILGLAKLRFIESDVVEISPLLGWKGEKKVVTFNEWVLERSVELKMAPIENKQDMYRLVPNAPLDPGVYALPSGLFGKLSLTDYYGSRLEMQDRTSIFGSEAFVFTISGGLTSQAETTSSKPSFETPEKISIASLTKDIPDADYFMARAKVINNPFDIVWTAANKYFSKDKYEITTSDPSKGILVVKAASWLRKTNRDVFVVLIENDSEIKTHVAVKAFCYTENANGWSKASPDLCSEVALKGIEKEVENQKKQSSLLLKESSSSSKDDIEKLSTFITDQWKQIIQIPQPKRDWKELITLEISGGKYDDYLSLYLLGVNRRNLASDALISANTFLTKKGDLKNAQKYAVLATRYYIESNDLFKASEQVSIGSISNAAQTLEAIYKGSSEATKYGLFLTCGPKCYEVADYIFLMTDFAVDYGLEGIDEAKKNLITKTFVKVLLNTGGVSKWIENRKIYHIGSSGLYSFMDKNINSSEFQRAITEVLVESGAYASKKLIETGAKAVIQNSLTFVKASAINDLKGPELMEEPVSNFKPGSEPEGFRGINWGTDISTVSSMQKVKTELSDTEMGLQAYLRDNDDLTLGGVPIKKVEYYFLKGKFMGVYIYLEGFDNWTNLKKVVFDKFGEGFQPPKTKEHYSLFGNNAGLTIKYDESLKEGSLFIFSIKMVKEIETNRKQKEKSDW